MPSMYEIAADETVPAARAMIAKMLIEKYGMKEAKVAELIGVTQAAISKYVNKKMYRVNEKIKNIESKLGDEKKLLETYVKNLSEDHKEYVDVYICTLCNKVNGFKCALSHAEQACSK